MKFSASGLLTVLLAAAAVGSVGAETNAERFARGLPPLPPGLARRATPTYPLVAKRTGPSSTPNPCTSGTAQCCGTLYPLGDLTVKLIAGLLGLDLSLFIGVTGGSCTPLTGTCHAKPVCCAQTYGGGTLASACISITI